MKESGNYVVANGKESFQLGEIDHEAESADDSKDSDAIQLFELPKRKLVRPISSSLRRRVRPSNKCWTTTKECCQIFLTVTLPMLIAVFIVSTILCLTFLLVGIAGMKQEISMLKIRLKNVNAAEENFIIKKEQLRKEFQHKLSGLVSYQKELVTMKDVVGHLSSRVDKLNITVHKIHYKATSDSSSKVILHDIDTLKNGMADTGADIEKLKANGNQLMADVGKFSKKMYNLEYKMYNMSVDISRIEDKPIPLMQTTPKTLVVTMTPDLDEAVSRKELGVELDSWGKKQTEACKKEISLYDIRLGELRNDTLYMNETHSNEISYLRHYLAQLQKANEKPSSTTSVTFSSLSARNTSVDYTTRGNSTSARAVSPKLSSTLRMTSQETPTSITPSISNVWTTKTSTISPTKEANATQTKESSVTRTKEANATQTIERNVNTTPPATMTTEPGNTTHNVDLGKVNRSFKDLTVDETLDSYKHNTNNSSKVNSKNKKPLLTEYIKKRILKPVKKNPSTDDELDNLDITNPE